MSGCREYNRFTLNNMSRSGVEKLLLGGARADGCSPFQMKMFKRAIDNKFALDSAKTLDQIQREALFEDLIF